MLMYDQVRVNLVCSATETNYEMSTEVVFTTQIHVPSVERNNEGASLLVTMLLFVCSRIGGSCLISQ